jgi:hypothetical protein
MQPGALHLHVLDQDLNGDAARVGSRKAAGRREGAYPAEATMGQILHHTDDF